MVAVVSYVHLSLSFEFFVHFLLCLVVDSLSLLALLARSVLVLGGLATLYASFCGFHIVMTLASSGCVLCSVPLMLV